MRLLTLKIGLLAVLAVLWGRTMAQKPSTGTAVEGDHSSQEPAQAQQSPYALHAGTRLVVEDVIVSDSKGNPVTGLPESAFHVQDNGAAQRIRNFSEISGSSTELPQTLPVGTYSNASLFQNSGVVIVMLLDPVSIDLPDQMYLRLQMLQYLKTTAPTTQVAVFRANGRGIPVLLQSLTSDRALLKTAIDESVPTITPAGTYAFSNAIAELANISGYLRAVPAKKVLLWFGGTFPLYLDPDLCSVAGPMIPTVESSANSMDCGELNDLRKEAFRVLEQARIAVYPIDVRGVVNAQSAIRPPTSTGLMNTPGSVSSSSTPEGMKLAGQYEDEDELAKATGGRAYHSNNALAAAIKSAVSTGSHSYTVVYQPEPYSSDGSWHKVRIMIDGGYSISYRAGYYAAASPLPGTRRLLQHDVEPASPTDSASAGSIAEGRVSGAPPIVFSAQLRSQGKVGKDSRFLIEYSIPASELSFSPEADGNNRAHFRLFAMAYNSNGDVLGNAVDTVQTHFNAAQMKIVARVGTPANQSIDAAKGAEFLLLAVQDLDTQRMGTVQIPVHSLKAGIDTAH